MDSPDNTLVPGFKLDRYELLCPIASGGMASVWLARLRGKRGFEKLFAVKTIKTELIADPHFQEMFLDEARIASRIVHPNVAQILELGEQDDILYLVMEYVDGDSLAKVNRLTIKKGSALPPGISLRIVAEVCAGLHAAHQLKDEQGESLNVVHRDVSPQNILLTTAGVAKVIDFGLVKARNRSAGETQSGVVKGKIRYMAPEQVSSRPIDHRADVWAAGMVLYELVTGHTPYPHDDDLEVVKKLMSEEPLPPFDVALPPQIEKILMKAIVKDPEGRYASCSAMRRAIEAAIHELELPAENDDVAEFVRETLPDLATKRQKTIAKAMEAAVERQGQAPASRASSVPTEQLDLAPGDIGYAATEVSARDSGGDEAVPLTRKRGSEAGDSDPDHAVSSYGAASRTTSTATPLREQLGERSTRSSIGYVIAGIVVVSAAAFLLWPRVSGSGDTSANNNTSNPTTPSAAPSGSSPPSSSAPGPDIPTSTLELDPINPSGGSISSPSGARSTPSSSPSSSSSPAASGSAHPAASGSAAAANAGDAGPAGPVSLSPGALSAARFMGVVPSSSGASTPPPPPPPAPDN